MRKIRIMFVVFGMIALGLATPLFAQDQQVCTQVDSSTEEVIDGVFLTWDSSFLCANAPDSGSYTFTVDVLNHADSAEAVTIDSLSLSHTTPRPGGQAPAAAASASGLPLTLAPGESGSFDVSGTYELVETDEGKKANLHLTASGAGVDSGASFDLGINAHFRAPGVAAE